MSPSLDFSPAMSAIFPLPRLLLLLSMLLLVACNGDEKPAPAARKSTVSKPRSLYTVKSGDTLYSIGVKHKLNYQLLAKLNAIAPPYTIAIGQQLTLPASVNSLPAEHTKSTPPAVIYSANLTESEFKKQHELATNVDTVAESVIDTTSVNVEKPPAPVLYVVQKNDTLYSISRRFHITAQLLATLNHIAAPEQLHAGQKLIITQAARPAGASALAENVATTPWINEEREFSTLQHRLPAAGKLLKSFSASGNRGIEIGGKLGQAVTAVAAGQVVAIKPAPYGYGLFVVIQHADGYLSSYANNSVILVQVGQKVKQNQVIARMGQVGRTMPSVKFEVRKNGQLTNPWLFLARQ